MSAIDQFARYFPSPDAARTWLTNFRDAKSSCTDFTVATDAGPTKVHEVVSDTGLHGDGFKLDVTIQTAGETRKTHTEIWTLRTGNAVVVLSEAGDSDAHPKALAQLASAEEERMTSKITAKGTETQTTTEACSVLTASGTISGTEIWNQATGSNGAGNRSLTDIASSFGSAATHVTNPHVKPLSDTVAKDLNEFAKVAKQPGAYSGSDSDPLVNSYNKLGADVGKLQCMGQGWTMDSGN